MSSVKITFDEKTLKKIPIVMSKYGFVEIAKTVKRALPKYMPKDTGSLLESYYFERDDSGKIGFLIVGSKGGDEFVNKIAILQHEGDLRHYGTPGKSMRLGVGDTSEGEKWIKNGYSIKTLKEELKSDTSTRKNKKKQSVEAIRKVQLKNYHKGYYKLKKDGALTKYKSEYLKKAVDEVVSEFVKIIAQQKSTEGK